MYPQEKEQVMLLRNNNQFYFLLILNTLFVFARCSDKKPYTEILHENGYTSLNTYDSSGSLEKKKIYKYGDSSNYQLLKYDKKGVLFDSEPYVNSKRHGIRKTITEDDRLVYTSYTDGEENGAVTSYYYPEMIIEYKGQVKSKDHPNGEWFFYDNKGRIISYDYYSGTSKLIYIRKYDSLGNTITFKGDGIIDFSYILDTIPVNSRFRFSLRVANPPNCEVEVYFGEMLRDSSIKREEKASVIAGEAIIEGQITASGKFNMGFIWELRDLKSGKIERSQQFYPFYVKD